MQPRELPQAKRFSAQKRRRRIWLRAVTCLACVVVFCTVYALILPAITMEPEPVCGLEAHVHDETCYSYVPAVYEQQLSCLTASLLHRHTADCYNENGDLICGQADFVIHYHDSNCYDAAGNLVCPLPVIPEHVHTEECYSGGEGHLHTEECYEIRQQLTCGLEESEGHLHDESCYDETGALICGLEENAGHVHSSECYAEEEVLICGLEETEGAEPELICELREAIPHVHEAGCYDAAGNLICGRLETRVHQHGESCMTEVEISPEQEILTCGLPEHVHTEDCYPQQEPTPDPIEEEPEEEVPAEEESPLTDAPVYCGKEAHTHSEECYWYGQLACELEEHIHTEECYNAPVAPDADPNAGLETQADWESSIADVTLTGEYRQDVLAIAESQLGYTACAENYIIDENGQEKRISRYGQWYGDPYGDWCAMFVSFCLHYADVDEMPLNANCQKWIETLSKPEYDLFYEADGHMPIPGDLVFFDYNRDGVADHVGLVSTVTEATDAEPAQMETIERGPSDQVQVRTYSLPDEDITGYASLPEQQEDEGSEASSNDDTALNENESPDEVVEAEDSDDFAGYLSDEVASVDLAHSNETITIHVQKQWTGDAAYTRPDSIEVTLWMNESETDQKLTLTAEKNWAEAFSGNFAKYDDEGSEILYEVKESAVANYDLVSNTYTDTAAAVDLSTLELWVPVTELTAGENYLAVSGLSGKQSLYRAESTVTDGVLSASVSVNEGSVRDLDGNTYTNYILLNPEDETGQSYYLTWKAVEAGSGMNLQSNVYIAWNGKTEYLLSKSQHWKITEDGTLPDAIFTSDGSGGFQAGSSSPILYLFKKVSLNIASLPDSSYTRNYTLVNRYEPADTPPPEGSTEPQATSTSVQVTKQWDDDQTDHSNDSITVWLLRDGERTKQYAVLSAENNWTYTFDNLPIYSESNMKYVYDVQEEETEFYQPEYQYETSTNSGEAVWLPATSFEDGVTYLIVTSATTGDVVGMEASSKGFAWTADAKAGTIHVDSNDTYTRYITDEEAQQHTAMQWIAESKGLQKGEQVGTRYVFALKNVQYGLYAKNNGQGDLSSDAKDKATWWYYGYTLIDENGEEAKRYPKKTPESDWSYVLGSLNDYFLLDNNHTGDGGSQAAQTFYLYRRYEVQEPKLIVTITNHRIKETSLTVLKDWINDEPASRPSQITIHLLANGDETENILILSTDNEWTGFFEHLPVEDEAGNPISYTVAEDPVAGYNASYFYSTEEDTIKVVISNRTLPQLPETGGIGTVPYATGGALLMISAGILLLYIHVRRRKEDSASS